MLLLCVSILYPKTKQNRKFQYKRNIACSCSSQHRKYLPVCLRYIISQREFSDDKETYNKNKIQQCNRKANTISGCDNNMAARILSFMCYNGRVDAFDVTAQQSIFRFTNANLYERYINFAVVCPAGRTATRSSYYVHSINV